MPEDGEFKPRAGQTGTVAGPMIFYFYGDDDVWVYDDQVLNLDVGGIHQEAGGYINYQQGTIGNFEGDQRTVTKTTYMDDLYLATLGLGPGSKDSTW